MIRAVVVLTVFVAAGCGSDRDPTVAGSAEVRDRPGAVDPGQVVATVDGQPISARDVESLLAEADAGLTPRAALDALVEQQLLAAEARRRGFASSADVAAERDRALARALLEQRVSRIGIDELDQQRLRAVYDKQIDRFVHGPQRRVVHAVAIVGEQALEDDDARELASRVYSAVRDATSAGAFREAVEPIAAAHEKSLLLENLPPFAAGSKRFVGPFVDAVFALASPGSVSKPFRTSFGWHVALLIEELPAVDVPFEEAREIIGRERLPVARARSTESLLEELRGKAGVFVLEPGLKPDGAD
jgi:hypothetical protein